MNNREQRGMLSSIDYVRRERILREPQNLSACSISGVR